MSEQEIRESRAVCDEATPGPWIYDNGMVYCENPRIERHVPIFVSENDAAFIAHARTALPKALDALADVDVRLKNSAEANRRLLEDRDRLQSKYEALENFTHRGKEVGCCSCRHRGGGPVCDDCKLAWPRRWEFEEGGERDE